MSSSSPSPIDIAHELRNASGATCTSRTSMLEILKGIISDMAGDVLDVILHKKNQTDWFWQYGQHQQVQTLRSEITWRLFDTLSNQEKTRLKNSTEFKYSWMARVQMDVVSIDALVIAINDKDHPISEPTRRAWLNSIAVYFWCQKALSDEHIAKLLPEDENDRLPFLDFANSSLNSFHNEAALHRVCRSEKPIQIESNRTRFAVFFLLLRGRFRSALAHGTRAFLSTG